MDIGQEAPVMVGPVGSERRRPESGPPMAPAYRSGATNGRATSGRGPTARGGRGYGSAIEADTAKPPVARRLQVRRVAGQPGGDGVSRSVGAAAGGPGV